MEEVDERFTYKKVTKQRKWATGSLRISSLAQSVLIDRRMLFHLNVFVIHILIKNSIKELNKNRYELYHRQYIF